MSESSGIQPAHRKHLHHVHLYVSLLVALIIATLSSLITFRSIDSCADPDGALYPNDGLITCTENVEIVSFGFPFIGDSLVSLAMGANLLFWLALVYGMIRAEVAIKGHFT